MSTYTINDAIEIVLNSLQGCVKDEPSIQRIIININNDFSNIERVTFHGSLPHIVRENTSILFETLDKAVIILSYIESFRTYVKVYRKYDIKSIILCMKQLDTQCQMIATTIEEIKQRVKR